MIRNLVHYTLVLPKFFLYTNYEYENGDINYKKNVVAKILRKFYARYM